MATSESTQPTLLERLSAVQTSLKAPKGQRNTFGNYNYRNCEDILEAVKPLLKASGLVLTLEDELVNIGDRYYVKATAVLRATATPSPSTETNPLTTLVHDDFSPVGITAYAREEETKKGMDGSQITGASSSYARKYALNGLFLIDDTKDSDATNDGNAASKPQPAKTYAPKPAAPVAEELPQEETITPSQVEELLSLAKKKGYADKPAAIEFLNTQSGLPNFLNTPAWQFEMLKDVVIKAGWSKG